MRKSILVLFTIFSIVYLFGAADGGIRGEIDRYGMGARVMGMGKAFVGLADDASAVYYNPAGLMQLRKYQVMAVMAPMWDAYTQFFGVAYVHPLFKLRTVLGATIRYLRAGGINYREQGSQVLDTFSMNNINLNIAVAHKFKVIPFMLMGATVKAYFNFFTLKKHLPDANLLNWSINADVGVLFQSPNGRAPKITPLDFLNKGQVAVVVRNFLSSIWYYIDKKNNVTPNDQLLEVILGLAYKYRFPKKFGRIDLAIDVNFGNFWYFKKENGEIIPTNKAPKVFIGIEYWILNIIAIRLGFDSDTLSYGTYGARLYYKNYAFDYAFIPHKLNSTHRVGIEIKFGGY